MFRFSHHHQEAYYLSVLSYGYKNNQLKYIVVVGLVVCLQTHHQTNHNDVF